jgi:hypothetical protein
MCDTAGVTFSLYCESVWVSQFWTQVVPLLYDLKFMNWQFIPPLIHINVQMTILPLKKKNTI